MSRMSTMDADKTTQKAADEFKKALSDFKRAADLDPTLYQAFNGMGYAYRKTGNYIKAIERYDLALRLAPNFPDAMEYRRGLSGTQPARRRESRVSGALRRRSQAGHDLLKAMTEWVGAHRGGVPEVRAAGVAAFDIWIRDRETIAVTTVSMSLSRNRSIWK